MKLVEPFSNFHTDELGRPKLIDSLLLAAEYLHNGIKVTETPGGARNN